MAAKVNLRSEIGRFGLIVRVDGSKRGHAGTEYGHDTATYDERQAWDVSVAAHILALLRLSQLHRKLPSWTFFYSSSSLLCFSLELSDRTIYEP